jgi:triosephosphate isomerase (TIM)
MRKNYIAGNWKMHKTVDEAVSLAKELSGVLKNSSNKFMIAPPFTALKSVCDTVKGTNILIGAQNMGPVESGAHTGEVSVIMLKDIGVDTVILGHSERRHVYGEDNEFINKKVKLALSHGLEVILCVGETLEEREKGITEKVVEEQVSKGLSGVNDLSNITVAYEPVWAIGTGKTATPEDADAVHVSIRQVISKLYDKSAADNLVIQYGGSVKPGNVKDLMAMENIDGALVGGASLTSENFVPIALFNE